MAALIVTYMHTLHVTPTTSDFESIRVYRTSFHEY